MANGYKRQRANKTISLPGGDSVVIPVLQVISVVDQNGQEVQMTSDNTVGNMTRQTHVDQVKSSHGSGSIFVERIDAFFGIDAIERGQESNFYVDNKTGGDATPPHFSAHQKTHVYRYYRNPNSPNDNGAWIDSELIDEFSVTDQNGQEHVYFLNNPEAGDMSGQADSSDPDITDNQLIRTDPFQNIIDFNGESPPTGGIQPSVFVVEIQVAILLSFYGAGRHGPAVGVGPVVSISGPAFANTIDGLNQAQIDTINSIASSFTGDPAGHFFNTGIDWGVTGGSTSGVTSWHVDIPPSVSGNDQTASFFDIIQEDEESGGLPGGAGVKYFLYFHSG